MIRLRLTMILWVSWISSFFFFCATLTAFIQAVLQGNRKSFCFFIKYLERLSEFSTLRLLFPSFFLPAPLLFSSCFVCSVLLVAPPFAEYKGAIHRWDNKFVVSPFLFHVASDFSPFPFSLSLFSETWKFVRLPPSPLWSLPLSDVVFSFLTSFCQSSSVFPFKVTDMGGCVACFFAHHTVFLSSRLFQSGFFCCLCSLPRSSHVSALKMKTSVLSAVCCLRSESFSSGSLPHAASLTARVKRTDPPRIANVLRGNQLNYAHCGGEGIHNTGIKLLKVTQYLALQLPAVYRRRGMFRRADVHMSCACVGRETDWGQTWRVMAYIGPQCSPQRCEMTVCWQIPS